MAETQVRPLSSLQPWDKNPRSIDTHGFARLKRLIAKLGLFKPFLITNDGTVLGGNMRLRAAKELGLTDVPVSIVEAPDEQSKLEYALADNDRVGSYDEQKLAELVLANPGIELDDFHVDMGKSISLTDLTKDFGPSVLDSYQDGESGELVRKYIVPPFSIFDTRQAYWAARKEYWNEQMGFSGGTREQVLAEKGSVVEAINSGVSLFDPVLCEFLYTHYCPMA
jgi:hypothetical protein